MAAPVFIKIDEYKEIFDIVTLLKNKIAEGKEIIDRINRIKEEEDSEISAWASELDEIASKIDVIDKSLVKV